MIIIHMTHFCIQFLKYYLCFIIEKLWSRDMGKMYQILMLSKRYFPVMILFTMIIMRRKYTHVVPKCRIIMPENFF